MNLFLTKPSKGALIICATFLPYNSKRDHSNRINKGSEESPVDSREQKLMNTH